MKRFASHIQLLIIVTAALSVSACGTWEKVVGKKADYKQSRSEAPLEIPPDLSSSTIEDGLAVPGGTPATLSEYTSGTQKAAPGSTGVLVQPMNMSIERYDDKQWLVVQSSAEVVWPKVRDFWLQNGFLLTMDDPKVGILETDWAENRADIPQDFIRRTIGKALDSLYSSATRDRFRMRLERTGADSTEIFITHRGMEEVVQGTPENDTGTIWKPRPNDPELEAEMLKRLMVSLGAEEQQAATQLANPEVRSAPRTQLVVNAAGDSSLSIDLGYSRAWREVGLALDRVGFTVEDRDRTAGVYYVRYNDPLKEDEKKGFLSKMAFWRDDDPMSAEQFRILLAAEGDKTNVTVLNAESQRDSSSTAKRILTLVQEQMQ
ncbi:MAG: outer membrane protein assembly factor BamC [Gammaproteobacteria bacterium]|nr:outer membrane protein assembly factor BamC [Gammaproteobacteria bacterium]MBU2479067.1 outer membrane protein assembly factor BamC [Gammaproteobacteria bacterium]